MWKDIRGYEGLYQVSDEGQIRRFYKGGRTKILKNKDGLYYSVSLSMNGEYRNYAVHRLVAEIFIPKPVWATEVNHKDGNRHNNRVENLEWVTQQENIRHSREVLGRGFGIICSRGKKPRPVRCLDKETGKLIKEFPSVSHAARSIPNNNSANVRVNITDCCHGKQPSAFGYKWEYINN